MKTSIEQTIIFGHGGNAEPHQLHGWSGPERAFTWSIGPECGLRLPKPDAPHGFFVEITGVAFAAPPTVTGQRISVKANGHVVGSISLAGPCAAAFYVAPLDPHDLQLVISIGHPDATRPSDVNNSGDRRELAFAFQSVRVMPLTEPYQPRLGGVACGQLMTTQDNQSALLAELELAVGLPASEFSTLFETLGDGCDLGFVQRSCGAEPLGLFRFSTAPAVPVLRGIDADFAGLADYIEPRLEARPAGPREWMIHEIAYEMRYHTFVHEGVVTAEDMIAREAPKLRFLRRKIVEDIAEANKIFVLNRHDPPLTYAEALPIYLALRRRSANRLLWLSMSDERHPVGLVHEIHPGLMQAYMDRLWPPHDPSLVAWLTVLINAWTLTGGR